MTTIHIAASRAYDVAIEPGLLSHLGSMAAELLSGRRPPLSPTTPCFPYTVGWQSSPCETLVSRWSASCSPMGNSRKI